MRRKLYSTFAVVFCLGTSFLFTNATENVSLRSDKFSKLKPHSHDRAPANYNKARAPIYVTVTRIDESTSTETIRLKGTVKALRDFQNLKVEWAAPEDVEVLSGSTEMFLTMAAGESQSFEILISQKTSDNRKIFFHATSDQAEDDKFGATAQYNTTQQNAIAKHLKENFLKARAKVRSGELRKIIF